MSPQADENEATPKVQEIQPPRAPKPPRLPMDIKMKIMDDKRQEYNERAKAAKAAGVPIEPFVEDEEEEEDLEGCESEDLLFRNTMSFRCLAQVVMSSSSLLRSVEYNFPPVEDPGIDEAMEYIETGLDTDDVGLTKYFELSKTYKVVPLRRVQSSLATPILNLKFYGLRKYQMKCLMEALKTNNYVENLIIQDNFLSPQMAQMLGKMIEENGSIQILNMKHCNIGPQGAAMIGDSIGFSHFIKELDISYNNLGDEGLKYMENGLGEIPTLEKLNLSHNNLTPESAESLEIILMNNKNLSDFDLSWNRLGSDECYDVLFNAIAQSDRLRVFNLSNNGFCADLGVLMVFTVYLQQTTKLQELDLSWNRIPAGKFIKEIRKGVLVNQSLRILKLGFNPWTPEEAFPLSQLIALSPNLQVLDMENIWFTKRIKRVLLNAQLNNKVIIIGGIYQNWEIKGPDWTLLIWRRIRAVFMAPKKPSKKQEFGNLLLNLPMGPMKRSQFEEIMRKMRYVKLFEDPELGDSLCEIYTKDFKLDTLQMTKDYLKYFSAEMQKAPPSKKKKKGKKGSKGSSRVSIKTDRSLTSAKKSKSLLEHSKSSIKGSKTSQQKSHVSIVSEKGSKELEAKQESQAELQGSQAEIQGSKVKIGSRVSIRDSKERMSLIAIQEEHDTEISTHSSVQIMEAKESEKELPLE